MLRVPAQTPGAPSCPRNTSGTKMSHPVSHIPGRMEGRGENGAGRQIHASRGGERELGVLGKLFPGVLWPLGREKACG